MSERNLVTAHQANFLPYLGFFEKISVSDAFVLVDDTQFVKRGTFGWIHRNKILTQNGPIWLTIPIKTHDAYNQLISDTQIVDDQTWKRKHLRSIEFAYKKAKYFDTFFDDIKDIYLKPHPYLLGLSRAFIEWVLQILKIDIPMTLSSELGIQGKGSDYVLELASKSKASHYLSGKHGLDYLNPEIFVENNVEVIYQDFNCMPYEQINSETFHPNMCILDVLFNVGVEGTIELLKAGSNYNVPVK
jgi:hypothetical protein